MAVLLVLLLQLWVPGKVMALSNTIASVVSFPNGAPSNAAAICAAGEQFIACDKAADSTMFGVIDETPPAYIDDAGAVNGKPVVTSGVAAVMASNTEGEIQAGDFVTSSEIPGVLVRANNNGYVMGIAQENLVSGADGRGLIAVYINIHFETELANVRSNLMEVLQQSRKSLAFAPLDSLRYFLSAVMVLLSFILGFIYFGKTSASGVEAIGRNPLAQKQIRSGVILHLFITTVVVLLGLFAAYLILIL